MNNYHKLMKYQGKKTNKLSFSELYIGFIVLNEVNSES